MVVVPRHSAVGSPSLVENVVAAPGAVLRRTAAVVLGAATIAGLLLVLLLSVISVGPRILGWHATTVLSDSMAPALRYGDIVLTAPASAADITTGDVLRFVDPAQPERHLLHRVVRVDADGTVHTAGDANAERDSSPLPPGSVGEVARVRLPGLGAPAVWAGEHPAPATLLAGGLTVALTAAVWPARRRHRRARNLRTTTIVSLIGTGSVLACTVFASQTSTAGFTFTTTNPADAWTAGVVALGDDDGGSTPTTGTAMFAVTGLTAATPQASRCITVTYSGNITAAVRTYATNHSGTGLGTYLNLTVDVGTGGGYASCTGFSFGSTLYSGTLAGYAGTYADYASGLPTGWTPSGNDQRTFRITYSLQNNPSAPGTTASANLVWEAQS